MEPYLVDSDILSTFSDALLDALDRVDFSEADDADAALALAAAAALALVFGPHFGMEEASDGLVQTVLLDSERARMFVPVEVPAGHTRKCRTGQHMSAGQDTLRQDRSCC